MSNSKSPVRPLKRCWSNIEQKLELRVTKHESLRERLNVTTCRSIGKARDGEWQDGLRCKRQQEFLKRRKIISDESPQEHTRMDDNQVIRRAAKMRSPQELMNRRSLIRAEDLHISWPDFTSSQGYKVPQFTEQLRHKNQLNFQEQDGVLTTYVSRIHTSEKVQESFKSRDRGVQTCDSRGNLIQYNTQDSSIQTENGVAAVLEKEILELSDYLQEALVREQALKKKLAVLQHVLSTLLCSSEKLWKAQCNEDLMKRRLGSLESQLHLCMQGNSGAGLKAAMIEMESHKLKYEEKAKESLQKVLEEKQAAEKKLQSLQTTLQTCQEESSHWKTSYEKMKASWDELNEKHSQTMNEMHLLQDKLQRTQKQENRLQEQLLQLHENYKEATAKIEILEEDSWQTRSHLNCMEGEYRKLLRQFESAASSAQTLNHKARKEPSISGESEMDMQKEKILCQLQAMESQLAAKEKECSELRGELEALEEEYQCCQRKLQQCREELNTFQRKKSRKRCSKWILLPMAILFVAVAVSFFCPDVYDHISNWLKSLDMKAVWFLP
ncbi:TRAF3-interacting JNK-activating modulator isoform X1 [Erpetoichthys calabaricus]|uniref:TRAF3-interacting JNK-activating modulator isoform X1 n=1 Tax=Erpetoichthys calabaricus TaxID=27687 RepID=UPI00223406E1|nr:TRAF3-interacting JNK-activating modulator isoform X1 [Erpetoichthys calabaricus]